ncbi:MAG: hypothetical protein JXR94_19705 [Candidatus Hydrogenedentes bacterium]|nr:hypothetical protein [Candidatus Hydrogenedentota bacterium]
MEQRFELTPADKEMPHEIWQLVADLERGTFSVFEPAGQLYDTFDIEDIATRITMPEFAGATRWPRFHFEAGSIVFKVDKRCLRFLKKMHVLALCLGEPEQLRRLLRKEFAKVALGVLFLLTVAPACTWLFVTTPYGHSFKARSFGLMAGSIFMGFLLIINPGRHILAIRQARKLQDEMGR